MTSVSQLCQTFQTVLTTIADHAARTTGFVQRTSKLTGAKFAQTLVFAWWSNPNATYEQLAQTATGLGVPITAQGLDGRFTAEAAECLKQILEAAVHQVVVADPVAIPLLQRFAGGFIQDSTTIVLPDALAEVWRGCGGNIAKGTAAALKVQAQVNMRDGQFTHLDLQAGRAQDKTAPMQTAPLPAGALRLADLGYLSIPVLRAYGEQGVYWLTRYQATVLLFNLDGQPFDLATFLQTYSEQTLDRAVQFSGQHRLPCRLIAVRVPAPVAEERRRKLHAEARREGRTPRAKQLVLCDWVILVTNVPTEQVSIKEALVLARLRWQIELVFKLWKSHGQVDESRSAKPYRILCEVYAKLLIMLMHHWVAITCGWRHPNRSWLKTAQTIRQYVIALASALGSEEQLTQVFSTIQVCLAKGARINTRKTKLNLYQLLLVCGEEG